MNKSFKVLSVLLEYPTEATQSALSAMLEILKSEKRFSSELQGRLQKLIAWMQHDDLIVLQEQYVDLFDRNRKLSLHVFEHVHGESRDRGQAMVDLMEYYQEQGFVLHPSELPDYLPLILEFLSQIDFAEAQNLVRQFLTVLVSIHGHLQSCNSLYLAVFDAVIALTELEIHIPAIVEELAVPQEWIDEQWEESPIDFTKMSSCSSTHPIER